MCKRVAVGLALITLLLPVSAASQVYAQVLADAAQPHGVAISVSSNKEPLKDSWLATGSFNDAMNTTGWGFLSVESRRSASSVQQSFAAGYLEGFVTAQRSWEYITNIQKGPSTWSPQLLAFIQDNIAWVDSQVSQHATDLYWSNVGFLFAQLRGMWAGYNDALPADSLDFLTYYSATLVGDFDDLCRQLGCVPASEVAAETPKRTRPPLSDGHCSLPFPFFESFLSRATGVGFH
jgi:hypothetical protein